MTERELDIGSLERIRDNLHKLAYHQKYNSREKFVPYPKQEEHFEGGATKRERLLSAGNQEGKTYAGSYEAMVHLTGDYLDPPNAHPWTGKRFKHAVRMWIVGVSSVLVRDGPQMLLCGKPGVGEEFGTGMIPLNSFVDKPSMARGVTDAYDTIQVRHKSGGVSTATFKSYEMGREKFQSEAVDFIWCDEEPPEDIYLELLTRTNASNGIVAITFTPLNGMSAVVKRFYGKELADHPDRGRVTMTLKDAKHIKPEEYDKIINSYPVWQREARVNGVPMQGQGLVFPLDPSTLMEPAIPNDNIPPHWAKLWAVDFGIRHPFAAVLILWDRDNDVIHIHHVIRMKDTGPLQHAEAMRRIASEVPVAWPHDGNKRDGLDENVGAETVASIYRKHGLKMLGTHATFPDGGFSTEAGILQMHQRMTTGKLKVASHLTEWWEEFNMYHRDNGQIVKEDDDLMSATRIGVMAIRFAKPVPLGFVPLDVRNKNRPRMATGVDFDLF